MVTITLNEHDEELVLEALRLAAINSRNTARLFASAAFRPPYIQRAERLEALGDRIANTPQQGN